MSDHDQLWTAVAQLLRAQVSEAVWFSTFQDVTALDSDPSIGPCGAICVYPNHVQTAKEVLAGSPVKVASVATAFPSGQSPLDIKLDDTRRAVDFGADEIAGLKDAKVV